MSGRHAQTVFPYFLSTREDYQAEQHHICLADDDVIVLHDDCPASWSAGDRIVVLVHGLGGCHGSTYMVRLAATLSQRGCRVLRMDMRGCGAGLMLAKGVFHADRNSDLLAAIQCVAAKFPQSRITVCGFSLGANLTLKMLGRANGQLPPQLDSALAVAPPIDLAHCCHMLSRGIGWFYDRYFAKMLWRDFHQRRSLLAGSERVAAKRAPATLLAFDQAVTAPLAGFDSADAYYSSASSADVLDEITVPTVILSAADDPIVPVEIYERAPLSPATQLFIVEGGGHIGFFSVADDHAPDRRWMDHRLADWIQERDKHSEKTPPVAEIDVASFAENR